MKPTVYIPLIALILLTLACSLTGTETTPADETPLPPKSEKRCGDGVCDGPENPQNCSEDCPPDNGNSTESPASSGSDTKKTLPPWFAPDSNCAMDETYSSSEGSPWAFDNMGHTTELLPDGQVTCVLDIHVCGDTIFKQQVINVESEDCPESLDYSFISSMQVCCAKWDKAKQTGSPCNPMEDADCDGKSNDADAHPLDFLQQ
ncbi:MAG: hypothetical protein U9Q82_02390 [Chloroflexota bacterium]|nr:hypothetical protein [Chloroflexota bacterium]